MNRPESTTAAMRLEELLAERRVLRAHVDERDRHGVRVYVSRIPTQREMPRFPAASVERTQKASGPRAVAGMRQATERTAVPRRRLVRKVLSRFTPRKTSTTSRVAEASETE